MSKTTHEKLNEIERKLNEIERFTTVILVCKFLNLGYSAPKIAKKFNIKPHNVYDIKYRKSYAKFTEGLLQV